MRTHYPRTPHLPWSPGATPDDVRAGDPGALRGREVVVTEKLDGENTTLYRDGMHARSLDSAHHPSRAWVKALQGRIGPLLPPGLRVCGENLYARHSLAYEGLDSWFHGFSVWDGDRCLDWDRTVRFLRGLGIPVPPVLWRGTYDERALRALRLDTARQEGYVVRTVEGFPYEEFGRRVAKWVRAGHVTTGTHWMHAPVVENGLGPAAPLWAVRSGAAPDAGALASAVGLAVTDSGSGSGSHADAYCDPGSADRAADVSARLDGLRRTGDARLSGVLAALLHDIPRARLAARLAGPLGMPQARRVADLAGLHPALQRPYPDEDRAAGLARMALAADLGVLHAVAAAAAPDREAREQTEWSALHAEEAGLLGPDPLGPLRHGLRAALADLDHEAADRCWAEARAAYAAGRIGGAQEAVAATWRWRTGEFPRLIHLTGPAGSGKSTFAGTLPAGVVRIALDDLRLARGSRADQRANAGVLREGLRRLDAALAGRATVVWDATSLTPHQRSLVHAVARRRDALVTHVVTLAGEEELARRNARRAHPVPPAVLTAQARRFAPPYPGEAHRTWYVGADGAVGDTDGSLGGTATGQEA
ncbi:MULTISPECIES: RNA ligase family protein [unclassified Streptomyces]|uniref:RNA ligase family protein n=1 Tax=unclassified Streptomyces TaxID=2593676 RepID=UPI00037A014E|nr:MULTISPECIES: RNA ligase family protein [unclassified Streptomyces]MYX38612.1 AAA family ATPase [Streptomyces sp. SID8377]